MSLDGLRSSHPIEVPIKVAAEVDEIFDAISYAKGCCVVFMLINWLGEENFRKGMTHYLRKYSYQNAETDDLWNAIGEELSMDVSTMMNAWVLKTGFPVVTVTEQINGEDTVLYLKQNRFLEDVGVDTTDPTIWSIPICYIVCNADDTITEKQFLMTEREATITIPSNLKWIKFNKNQTGFFRLSYQGDKYYSRLIEPIRKKQLSAIDRMSIVEDAIVLAKTGLIPTDQVLTLLSAYNTEESYTVLSSVASCFSTIYNLLKHEKEDVLQKFNKFAVNTLVHLRDTLGWHQQPNESHLTSLTRPIVMSSLLKYKDQQTIDKALEMFDEFQKNHEALIPDLRGVAYSAATKYGDAEKFQQVFNVYQTSELNEERVRVLKGLGNTQDEQLILQTLNRVIDGSVRSQDVMYILVGTSQNPKATKLSWKFLLDNFAVIREKFESGFLFGRIIKLCTESVTDAADVKQLKEFLEKEKTKTIERTIDQSIETITLNSKWLERSRSNIAAWLNENVQ